MLRQHWRDYVSRSRKIAELIGKDAEIIESVLYELECQEPLYKEGKAWNGTLKGWSGTWMHVIVCYALVRLLRPELVVETGVAEGSSSRYLLRAMQRNDCGVLHSIDLPNGDFDDGKFRQRNPLVGGDVGWKVPSNLRDRWNLHLGDARELLPNLLARLGKVDMFIHDSLHSYDHMLFEYSTAWPHLREGGILLSDDIDWNTAFSEFATKQRCRTTMFNYRVGAIRKPESSPFAK